MVFPPAASVHLPSIHISRVWVAVAVAMVTPKKSRSVCDFVGHLPERSARRVIRLQIPSLTLRDGVVSPCCQAPADGDDHPASDASAAFSRAISSGGTGFMGSSRVSRIVVL